MANDSPVLASVVLLVGGTHGYENIAELPRGDIGQAAAPAIQKLQTGRMGPSSTPVFQQAADRLGGLGNVLRMLGVCSSMERPRFTGTRC